MADTYAFTAGKNVYDSETVTVSSSAISLTTSKVDNHSRVLGSQSKAAAAIIQPTANGFYYTLDGSTPSSSNGAVVAAGEVLALAGYGKIKKLKMIRSGASDAVVHVDYYN